jgi:hypothetical protein
MARCIDDLPDRYDTIGLGLTGVQLFVFPGGGRCADRAGRDRSLASPLTHALPPPEGGTLQQPVATSAGRVQE